MKKLKSASFVSDTLQKLNSTCFRFYHSKLQVQLYFSEIVICCENWPSNIRKLMYVQVDIVLGVKKKASRLYGSWY